MNRYALALLLAVFLSACGGGGDDGEYQEHDKPLDPPNCSAPGACT
jgi:hypothetical protein